MHWMELQLSYQHLEQLEASLHQATTGSYAEAVSDLEKKWRAADAGGKENQLLLRQLYLTVVAAHICFVESEHHLDAWLALLF